MNSPYAVVLYSFTPKGSINSMQKLDQPVLDETGRMFFITNRGNSRNGSCSTRASPRGRHRWTTAMVNEKKSAPVTQCDRSRQNLKHFAPTVSENNFQTKPVTPIVRKHMRCLVQGATPSVQVFHPLLHLELATFLGCPPRPRANPRGSTRQKRM